MSDTAVLLINLGTPNSPKAADVKKYLTQFLMDSDVVDIPWFFRLLLVRGIIVPFRSKKSSEAYQKVWTDKGSPLLVNCNLLTNKLKSKLNTPVYLSMRYGKPSITQILLDIKNQNNDLKKIILLPLYPHYAASTVKSCVTEFVRAKNKVIKNCTIDIIPPFYNDDEYINALYNSAKHQLKTTYDHILFSYHGIPERHILKADPTKKHCLKTLCCQTSSIAHKTCYKHQALQTTKKFVTLAGIPSNKYTVSFQSRLGKAKWLEPYTENKLIELAQNGVKKLLVISPSFTADCLETLEEIAIRGKSVFEKAGGENLEMIPCLNYSNLWVETIKKWIEQRL